RRGPQRLQHARALHALWRRQEERHPADRLHQHAAVPRCAAGRGDPAGEPRPPAADPDDDGHAGLRHDPDRARAWSGLRVARLARNTDRVLGLLEEAGVRGTFFVLAWNAERHPDVVRRIAAGGHEIACHGYGHRLVYELTPAAFREDVARAKAVLEGLVGAPV